MKPMKLLTAEGRLLPLAVMFFFTLAATGMSISAAFADGSPGPVTAGAMRDHIEPAACLFNDCNANLTDDTQDIADGTSTDTNADGIPDECQDCNNNGVLDPADIAQGTSADADADGQPDECEADCNANGLPDDHDIAMGTSLDAYGNGVPDECETDCNDNGISDYTELQDDMNLDRPPFPHRIHLFVRLALDVDLIAITPKQG